MKKALLILGLSALNACNGSFSAGYLIDAAWESNKTENPEVDISDLYGSVHNISNQEIKA